MPEPADLVSESVKKYYIEVNADWFPDSTLDFIDRRVNDIGSQLRTISLSLQSEVAMYRKTRPEPMWSNLMTFLGLVLALQEAMTQANQSHKGSGVFLDQSILYLTRSLNQLKSEVDRAKRRSVPNSRSQVSTSPFAPSQPAKINAAQTAQINRFPKR